MDKMEVLQKYFTNINAHMKPPLDPNEVLRNFDYLLELRDLLAPYMSDRSKRDFTNAIRILYP